MQLSKRLAAVTALVSPGNRMADIGTDHGYIPIYLLENNICPKAIAMDIRKGPLQRAQEHIREYGLEDRIETRLSDGTAALHIGEADTLVIAGMGGNVMIHILEDGYEVIKKMRECILQPQSDIGRIRCYLQKRGYQTVAEDMVLEEGKYYFIIKVIPDADLDYNDITPDSGQKVMQDADNEIYYLFGKLLLEQRHPVLKQFLDKKLDKICNVMQNIKEKADTGRQKLPELEKQKMQIEAALLYFEKE